MQKEYFLDGMFRAFNDTELLIKWYTNNVYLAHHGAKDINLGLEATAILKVLKEREVELEAYEFKPIENPAKFRNRLRRQFERIAREADAETLLDCYYGILLIGNGDISSDAFGINIFRNELKERRIRHLAPETVVPILRMVVNAFLDMADEIDILCI